MIHPTERLFVHCILQSNTTFYSCYKGDTSFSTLVQQFHKSLVKYYSQGGRHLYNPDEMEKFCESAAPGLFDDIFTAIYNDDKQAPSNKRTKLQRARVVALLHNLSFFRNQVWQTKMAIKRKKKENNFNIWYYMMLQKQFHILTAHTTQLWLKLQTNRQRWKNIRHKKRMLTV